MGEEHVTKEFCALQHQTLSKDITEIKEITLATHNKLFVGNGQPPITIQVDRHDRILGAFIWVVGVAITAIVGLAAEAAWRMFR